MSIAKYNNTLDLDQLHAYINENIEDKFFTSITTLDDIQFEPGLCVLENIHCLYFLFKEKPISLHKTKHLRLTHNKTKRLTT